jgi:twitching motility protein PilJ
MLNKTDSTKSNDAKNRASFISSEIGDNNIRQFQSQLNTKPVNRTILNRTTDSFKTLSLRTKATVLAIAIGTLPVLGIGMLAYSLASQSVTNKISLLQQSEAEGLSDKINRFMFERYGDIQVLANLPILINPKVRSATSDREKQALLNKFTESYKVYDSIAVLDLDGDVIVQSRGDEGVNRSDREYFKAVKESDRLYISPKASVSKSSGLASIYTAAPVKDSVTGQTIAIVRARMPLKSLEDLIKGYESEAGREYHLVDGDGRIFIATETTEVGKNVRNDFPGLDKLISAGREGTFTTYHSQDNQEQLVSYASQTLEGLPDLRWQVVLATDTASAFAPQRQLLWTMTLGTLLTALAVAAIGTWLARKLTRPILDATTAVSQLGEGKLNTRIQVESEDELGILGANINQMAQQLQLLLKEQELDTERAKLLADITLRIRRTLKTEDIYKTAVREIRQALKTDRVVVYNFDSNTWDGIVVGESVAAGYPKMMGVQIDDPCFRERHVESYKDGRVRAIANIYQDPSLQNAACYVKMLEKFAVKANLIAPIINQDRLVGLLITHQCDNPRQWQQSEIDLFKQLAIQIGYALEQATVLEELEKSKSVAERGTEDERRQKEELQMQLLELLSEVEGAASGDLTVRADVTAGEIGTVADFFNSIVESLRDIVTQVKYSASQVNQALGDNEGAIRELADEALSQAEEINRTLDAVDEMTHSMQSVAASAQEASLVANQASDTATKSGKAMDLTVQNILHLRETVGETAKKVKRLGESTQQISRVVSLINQIAMQTNLLAINAGIEAARAGEEGQGFAVVAEEVGELAARSAAATKEIEQIVENIQRETSEVVQAMEVGTSQVVEGTRVVEDAKLSLNQILDVSRQIDSLVYSISNATASQVEISQTVSELMKAIASTSQRTSNSSRQVSESLQQTVEISQQLQATVGTFKVD